MFCKDSDGRGSFVSANICFITDFERRKKKGCIQLKELERKMATHWKIEQRVKEH